MDSTIYLAGIVGFFVSVIALIFLLDGVAKFVVNTLGIVDGTEVCYSTLFMALVWPASIVLLMLFPVYMLFMRSLERRLENCMEE